MRSAVALSFVLASCGASSSTRIHQPAPTPPTTAKPAATPCTAVAAPQRRELTGWRDPDALPRGAVRRFGSKKLQGGLSVALLRDGSLVSGGDRVEVWRQDGTVRSLQRVGQVAAIDDDAVVIAGDGKVRIVRSDGTAVSEFDSPRCQINTVELSADGSRIACGWDDPVIYDTRSGEEIFRVPVDDVHIRAGGLAVHDKALVFLAGSSPELHVYDLDSKALLRRRKAEDVKSVALSRDGAGMYIIERSGALRRDLVATGKTQWRHELARQIFSFPLRPSRDDRFIATSYYDGHSDADSGMNVGVFDTQKRSLRHLGPLYTHGLGFSPDDGKLAVGSLQGLHVFDLKTGKAVMAPPRMYENIARAALFGGKVAAVTDKGLLRIWDGASGRPLTSETRLESEDGILFVEDLDFFEPTSLAVSARYSGTFIIDAETGRTRCHAPAHGHEIIPLGDGEHIAVHYAGFMPDDWPYGGAVAIVDGRCDVKHSFQYSGSVLSARLLRRGVLRLTVSDGSKDVAPERIWDEEISLGDWRKRRVQNSGRPISDTTDRLQELRNVGLDIERLNGEATLPLADGTSLCFDEAPQIIAGSAADVAVLVTAGENIYEGIVVDLSSRTIRRRITIPERGFQFERATIDRSGHWLAIIEDNSLLIYDLTADELEAELR